MKTRFRITLRFGWLLIWVGCSAGSQASAQTADYTYTTNNSTITITKYIGSGGAVSIPDTINGLSVSGIGSYAFLGYTSLTSVTIPDSVTAIDYEVFRDCTSLTDVAIPNSVTNIGSGAFWYCISLTSVTVPNNVTSIEGGTFAGCSSLTSVTIPNTVTSIGLYSFAGCTSLTSISIPNRVTSIGDAAFGGCRSLTNVTIPGSVTSVGDSAFAGCTSLTNVTIPNSVTNVGDYTFSGCSSLTAITVDSVNPKYSSVDGVLFNKSLTMLIQYPGGKVGSYTVSNSVTNIVEWAFSGCSSLTAITVDSVNPNYSSVDGVLFNKSQTTIIQCPGGKAGSFTVPNSVSGIWSFAFSGCTSLTAISVDGLNSTYSSVDGVLFDKNTITLIECPEGKAGSYTIPNKVTTIVYDAFSGCTSLTSVAIPASVTTIGNEAFSECPSLTAFTVDSQNSIYSSVDGVLFNKSKTTIVQCPGGKAGSYTVPGNVTSIRSYAFKDCTSLTSVTIPNSVSSIGQFAFESCTKLTEVYFEGNALPTGFEMFRNDYNVTVYYLPGTTGWGTTFGGRPTALWVLPNPLILTIGSNFGVKTNQFGFIISWATNSSVVVEASTNLASPTWSPVGTNTLTNGSSYFSDPGWTNYSSRFYRIRPM